MCRPSMDYVHSFSLHSLYPPFAAMISVAVRAFPAYRPARDLLQLSPILWRDQLFSGPVAVLIQSTWGQNNPDSQWVTPG